MYVLDSNIFIQAANSFYAFDLAPPFWSWLERELGRSIFTIVPVRSELYQQDDKLSQWFKSVDDPAWVHGVDSPQIQAEMPIIAQHCFDHGYKDPGIRKFLSVADPWVVAKAKYDGLTVVTHEVADPRARKRVKIPDVCNHFNVRNVLLFDMLRTMNFRFR